MQVEQDVFEEQWKVGTEDDFWVRTCAWSAPGCHPVGCGLKLHVVDGMLVDVEGDETHPVTKGRLCARCLTLAEYIYHPDRVIYPQKRIGPRGSNKWERISWDEAIDTIVERTEELQAKYGRETVAVFSGTGRQATLYGPSMAFGVFRSPYHVFAMSGQACYGPRCAVSNFILGGTGYPEIDIAQNFPDSFDNPEYTIPECIIVWGKNPLPSNPDGLFGHAVVDLMRLGTKIITIDPRITWLASRAEIAIQVRPGTDAAIAMAMLNVIIQEDLYDHDFVEKWTYGFDEIAERVSTMSPESAAAICWCEADEIREAARLFANSHPASICWGLAFDQQLSGGQAGHCVIAMQAICGDIDVPGGLMLGKSNDFIQQWMFDTNQCLPDGQFDHRVGSEEFPVYSANNFSVQPDIWLETLENGYPTKFTMAVFQSSNVLSPTCNVLPQRWYEALQKLEFVVVTDLFMNPTAAALADIFLPVTTFAEQNAVVTPWYGTLMPYLGAINKAIDVGETKSDIEIDILLGRRLNPELWPWETAEEFFEDQVNPFFKMSFGEFQDKVVLQPTFTYEKYKKGALRADGHVGFNSPSGRIELYCTSYDTFGEDPLPYFKESPYSPVEGAEFGLAFMKRYPLVLTTGARKYTSFHSEHRMIESLRQIDPWPLAQIHPDTAAEYDVIDGSWVNLENMHGTCKMKVQVTSTIMPGVVMAQHGWWFPEEDGAEPNLFGVWKANVNMLFAHKITNPLGWGSIHKSMCCTITKADGLND
jgi:anaerobic selenocysteine-containing dehydrogenase